MLRLYFLGEQRVSEAAASVTPSLVVGRALEILAALVVNAGRPQERERLAGLQWNWKADMFAEIGDAAIDVHAKYGALLPTGHSTMHMYPIDGAAMRVDAAATAFPYRGGGWAGTIVGVDPDPANAAAITEWSKAYWNELHPTSAGEST